MGKMENERSKNDEVCTPAIVFQPILDALRWKAFDLDPCSHPRSIVPARTAVLLPQYSEGGVARFPAVRGGARRCFIYADGLQFTWRKKRTWLNPPYSQLQYTKRCPWLVKARDEASRCVALLPVRTSSGWWHEFVRPASARCYWKGRIQHVGEKWGSPFHQALVFWGFTPPELDALEMALDSRQQGQHWFERG
jgi:hypothetical protein